MKNEIDNMKDEIIKSKNEYNDLLLKNKNLQKDYDNLNKDYSSLKRVNDNLKSIIDEQKAELFNNKKEIYENKTSYRLSNSNLNDEYYENNDFPSNKKNIKHKKRVSFYDEEDLKNNKEDSIDEENIDNIHNTELKRYNNINSKYNYKYKGINKNKNSRNEHNSNYIKKNDFLKDEIERKKSPEKPKEEDEYVSLLIDKDKIIGCDKEKINKLIDDRENQIVEKELSVLIKEKEKLENRLFKYPEHPKKLSDIRNKKEINEIIEKLESDIGYIRIMLKKNEGNYKIF